MTKTRGVSRGGASVPAIIMATTGSTTTSGRRRATQLPVLLLLLAGASLAAAAVPTTTARGAPPPPHLDRHHDRHPLPKNATYSVGLSATGFLLPFVQGALEALVDIGVVHPGQTPVAGTSGGAVLALAACSGASPDATNAALEALAERCRPRACTFTQDDAVREALGRIMDAAGAGGSDVAQRCRGKAFAAISVAFGGEGGGGLIGELRRHCAAKSGQHPASLCIPRALHSWWWHPRLWVVGGDWRDRQDLADGVAASAFFPVLSSAKSPFARFRGRSRLLDGVYASPLPLPPLADNSRPVRVSSVPLGTSAAPWSKPIVEAEIAPFLRVKAEEGVVAGLPSAERWRRFLLLVPSADERKAMRELGRREALAWWSEEVVRLSGGGVAAS